MTYISSLYPPVSYYIQIHRLIEVSCRLHSPPLPRIDYQLIAMLQHPLAMTRRQQRPPQVQLDLQPAYHLQNPP